ncbi:putative molybdopterin biosynthesis protein MoeA [Oscillibacter valericigenes Sjm18-20]|nr:putative molybdopterin biosynthesis protein MoeA [Oscillibacter valericigenes Sjm18-20]
MKFNVEELVPSEKALALLFDRWMPVPETETVPLNEAVGRVLAENQFAKYTLPVVRAAMMDSIALRSMDFDRGIPDTSGWTRGVEYEFADMGDDFDDRFDAVIPVEEAKFLSDGTIRIREDASVHPGAGIRKAGTIAQKGELLLPMGCRLVPTDLCVLATGGIREVPVFRRPVVAIIPTGSELIPLGEVPQRGQNIDSNSLMLKHMALSMGAEPLCYPIVKDIPNQMSVTLEDALAKADIVVVNAGSSKGEEDFSTRLLRRMGTFLFHGVRAVPGRPMSVSLVGSKPVVNLPGPPIAAFNAADWCLRAVVSRFLQTSGQRRPRIKAILTAPLDGPPALRCTSRMRVYRADGTVYADPVPKEKGSTVEIMAANGVYISPVGEGRLEAGREIDVELLRSESSF